MAVIKSRYAEAYISPMTDFGITVGFNLAKHTGLDFAWVTNPYAPIYPIQNGKVVDVYNALDGDGAFSPERAGGVP